MISLQRSQRRVLAIVLVLDAGLAIALAITAFVVTADRVGDVTVRFRIDGSQ